MNPRISIVSPSFNQGRFIEDAIKSVLSQNYDNFEHIVIDGGSTDNTIEILKKYPHLIWVSEPDEGQSDALNKGFRMVTGDIIGWLNTDDYYLPGIFNIVANELSGVKTDAIYSDSRFVDASRNVISEFIAQNPSRWISLFKCYIPSETFFFKRSILMSGFIIEKQFKIAMDMEFFAQLLYSGYNIRKVNAFFGHFRWHDKNKSIDTKQVRSIRIKEGLEIFNRYSGFKLPNNNFGISIYKILLFFLGGYRTIYRMLSVGMYKKNKNFA